MKIVFTENAWKDLSYWIENDISQVKKIRKLINAIKSSPFTGIGKPEPLKHQLKGYWSRRINMEHRLIYEITDKNKKDQLCTIIQCRYHYR